MKENKNRKVVCGHPLPKRPSDHLPGTDEKVRELKSRWKRGEYLFHPDDRQRDDYHKQR